MTATCTVCAGPYAAVADDPSPAHPSCAPSDPTRFDAATSGPRTYRGVMSAVLAMGCVCGATVPAGGQVTLTDTAEGVRWVCASCASAVSAPAAPPIALGDARESRRGALRAGNDHETATRRSA